MYFLLAAAVLEFGCVVYFYQQTRILTRTIFDRDDTIEALLNDSDEVTAEQSRRSEVMLGTILNNTEFLMSSLDEVKAEQAITDAKIDAVKTDVETLLAKLAAVPTSGLTAEQQAAIDDIAAHAKAINDKLSAVDATVNPASPVV